jgi:hypothetical protein
MFKRYTLQMCSKGLSSVTLTLLQIVANRKLEMPHTTASYYQQPRIPNLPSYFTLNSIRELEARCLKGRDKGDCPGDSEWHLGLPYVLIHSRVILFSQHSLKIQLSICHAPPRQAALPGRANEFETQWQRSHPLQANTQSSACCQRRKQGTFHHGIE